MISEVIAISGPFVIITASLAKYITIAVFSGFLELTKVWEELVYFIGLFAFIRCISWKRPLCLLDQANCKTRIRLNTNTWQAACEENPILSNTKVKFINLILYPYPKSCLLYLVHIKTSSPKKRTGKSTICRRLSYHKI